MKTKYRNEIFEIIESLEFDPSEFQWDMSTAGGPILHHVKSGGQYKFEWRDRQSPHNNATFSPGENDSPTTNTFNVSWENRYNPLHGWLTALREEQNTEDLWAEIEDRRQLIGDAADDDEDNSEFAADEKEQIVIELGRIQQQIEEKFAQTDEHRLLIEAKIKYLQEAVKRVGRLAGC